MDTLKVNIDVDGNSITVWNNGGGIPVQMHTGENCWLPELIFGHLLTSRYYIAMGPDCPFLYLPCIFRLALSMEHTAMPTAISGAFPELR